MSMNIFLPSLPAIALDFDTPYVVVQLTVSLYLATSAVIQLVIGPLSDRYGRRPVMLVSIAIFMIATVGCLVAPNIELFLLCRMLQTAVISGMVIGRAVVRDLHEQDQAASQIAYVTAGVSLVPMFAPMIGGALDQLLGWQSSFVFMLIAGAAIGWIAWADMGETANTAGASMRRQFRDYPDLLTSRRFWGYGLATAFASGAFFAFLGGAPYAASVIFGLSPFWTGLGFGSPAVGYLLGNFLSGRFSARAGINPMILLGATASTLGLGISVLLGLLGLTGPVLFFAFLTTVGLGNGLVIPNGTAGMLSVRPHLAGTASGLGGTIMIGGGAALSVLAGILLEGSATSLPLQWLMFLSSLAALVCILYVIRRERQLGLAP
jgi:DHA1 family bicyclomycin/chloramphenicol resistance-like MFS transporter